MLYPIVLQNNYVGLSKHVSLLFDAFLSDGLLGTKYDVCTELECYGLLGTQSDVCTAFECYGVLGTKYLCMYTIIKSAVETCFIELRLFI
jgi:hypothetical protein